MLSRKILIPIVMLMACLLAGTALAQGVKERMIQRKPQIDALLARGVVGENNVGLLQYRGQQQNTPVVAAENKDRTMVYQAIAKKAGASPDVVGQRRASKIAQMAAPGTWLQNPGGDWYQK